MEARWEGRGGMGGEVADGEQGAGDKGMDSGGLKGAGGSLGGGGLSSKRLKRSLATSSGGRRSMSGSCLRAASGCGARVGWEGRVRLWMFEKTGLMGGERL